MHLKKESRILVVDELDNFIIGLIIRGVAGIENSIVFRSCSDLHSFLAQGSGIAGEINYIILNNDTCIELKSDTRFKVITINDIGDRELVNEVNEVLKIVSLLSLKYSVMD